MVPAFLILTIASAKPPKTPAKIAGLEVKRIINEPTAACVGLRPRHSAKEEKIAV